MTWQPIETAPKGKYRTVQVGNKGGEREVFEPCQVIVGRNDGFVTISYWVEKFERWNMFSKDAPPTHWWDFGGGASMPEPPK